MSYTSEAKDHNRTSYGHYCNFCKDKNVLAISYTEFKQLHTKSRYLSKLLRHKPEDLELDTEGYTDVNKVLIKLDIDKTSLDWIVISNDKKRFSYNTDETFIRANQGHSSSLNVNVSMREAERIDVLYHGTSLKNKKLIDKYGIRSMNRKHVHLSKDLDTAINVAKRHSKDVYVYKINAAKMRADNVKIYISDNDVYLTDYINTKYFLKIM